MAGDGWALPSASGREIARWTVTGERGHGDDSTLTCDVELAGRYYGETLDAGVDGDRPDFRLVLRGLALPRRELARLASWLAQWLALPAAALHESRLEVSRALGGLFDQSFVLRMGPREDVTSGGRPVATLAYCVGRMRGELVYTVDPDGLRRFAAGIERALADRAPAGPPGPGPQ
jgi:hypothetical protein